MPKISVSYPIEVPVGPYCWEKQPNIDICKYFTNEGGRSRCGLDFFDLKDTKEGIIKTDFCKKLVPFVMR